MNKDKLILVLGAALVVAVALLVGSQMKAHAFREKLKEDLKYSLENSLTDTEKVVTLKMLLDSYKSSYGLSFSGSKAFFDIEDDPYEIDTDLDDVPNVNDNCHLVPNPNQEDSDNDGLGNLCDSTPFPDTETEDDSDFDDQEDSNIDTNVDTDSSNSDNQNQASSSPISSTITFSHAPIPCYQEAQQLQATLNSCGGNYDSCLAIIQPAICNWKSAGCYQLPKPQNTDGGIRYENVITDDGSESQGDVDIDLSVTPSPIKTR